MTSVHQSLHPAQTDGPVTQPGDITLAFEDNRIAGILFGEHDRNLALIEHHTGVDILPRGNRLTLRGGTARARTLTREVLEELYKRAREGHAIDTAEVEGVIRLFATLPVEKKKETAREIRTRRKVIRPRSAGQQAYLDALAENELVFGIGPAGTGKTYLAVAHGIALLLAGEVERLILSRPAVEAGEQLGFLPGDMKEKVDPYLRPLYDALHDMLTPQRAQRMMADGTIEIAPLAFMRGRTLSHACVILDEAQNTTAMQMKMFLTRLGEGARMVITGDLSQIDLPAGVTSGLRDAVDKLAAVKGVAVVRFSDADIVRHPLVARIVEAYDAAEKDAETERGK
jgi:phosphate starvation-inducible PhoH-like protein